MGSDIFPVMGARSRHVSRGWEEGEGDGGEDGECIFKHYFQMNVCI